jgi:hypothetical protein
MAEPWQAVHNVLYRGPMIGVYETICVGPPARPPARPPAQA